MDTIAYDQCISKFYMINLQCSGHPFFQNSHISNFFKLNHHMLHFHILIYKNVEPTVYH